MFLDGILLTEHYSMKRHDSATDKRWLVKYKYLGIFGNIWEYFGSIVHHMK